jgi:hypothetical protein
MVLQLLILWDGNDCYRRLNLPFAVSILFKTLKVLIVSITYSIDSVDDLGIHLIYFVGRPRHEVMGSVEHCQIRW